MKRKLLAIVLITLILCVTCCVFAGCKKDYPSNYTLEEHIERITPKIEKRFINEETRDKQYSFITTYKLYPLYDYKDELSYFLIEFEPYGFAFVSMNEATPFIGMYYLSDKYVSQTWWRYRICIDGQEPNPYKGKQWLAKENDSFKNFRYEMDDNDKLIEYSHSPYAIATVLNEKLYLLDLHSAHVPAIKQDGKYINLVSMEEFDYKGDVQFYKQLGDDYVLHQIPSLWFGFIFKETL